MKVARLSGAAATFLVVVLGCAVAHAFDPRRMDGMLAAGQLPDPAMTADQVKAACLRLFNGKSYAMTMAVQDYGRAVDSPWTIITPVLADFRTDGRVAIDPATARPACFVFYSWRDNSRWLARDVADLRTSFDGRILYRFVAPPEERTGILMEAQGNALELTEFFYYPIDRDARGGVLPDARVYRQWGRYTRD